MTRLFLDDYRIPVDCASYMHARHINCNIYHEEWIIIRNYLEFTKWIKHNGLPDLISFDHDLADEHYHLQDEDWTIHESEELGLKETGYDCAKWLINYCIDNKKKLPLFVVHSMNPVGYNKIKGILNNFKNKQDDI